MFLVVSALHSLTVYLFQMPVVNAAVPPEVLLLLGLAPLSATAVITPYYYVSFGALVLVFVFVRSRSPPSSLSVSIDRLLCSGGLTDGSTQTSLDHGTREVGRSPRARRAPAIPSDSTPLLVPYEP